MIPEPPRDYRDDDEFWDSVIDPRDDAEDWSPADPYDDDVALEEQARDERERP